MRQRIEWKKKKNHKNLVLELAHNPIQAHLRLNPVNCACCTPECMLSPFSHVRLFVTLWTVEPTRLLCPWDSPGKETRVGCHALLQGVFLTQGSNLHKEPDGLQSIMSQSQTRLSTQQVS